MKEVKKADKMLYDTGLNNYFTVFLS